MTYKDCFSCPGFGSDFFAPRVKITSVLEFGTFFCLFVCLFSCSVKSYFGGSVYFVYSTLGLKLSLPMHI